MESDSIDLVLTDPPYGYSFMNKDWDKAVIGVDTWKECLRVLKPGAFAFIMSSPRQDVLCKMILNLIDSGFETNFTSIYWTYASGFPKAADVSKLTDKRNGRTQETYRPFADYIKQKRLEKGLSKDQIDDRLGTVTLYSWFEGRPAGIELPTKKYYLELKEILELDNRFDELIDREEAQREIIASRNKINTFSELGYSSGVGTYDKTNIDITKPATEQAKALDGSYAGFQPKPALEICLVVMKPLSEKSFTDQALANGKGITWLDSCRIPYESEDDMYVHNSGKLDIRNGNYVGSKPNRIQCEVRYSNQKGRFPANLLVSDDILNDGKITKSDSTIRETPRLSGIQRTTFGGFDKRVTCENSYNDSGSYSRYFSLDKWFDTTLPFLITPKASKKEKNMGLITSYMENKVIWDKEGLEDYTDEKSKFPQYRKDQIPIVKPQSVNDGRLTPIDNPFQRGETIKVNYHPTVKPIKLMTYLIMLGSRKNDIVLDPFCGSGSTCIAAKMLGRDYIGIEINKEYCDIAQARLLQIK